MVKLKMVKGKTFMCPPVLGDRIVVKGEFVEVPEDKVQVFLDTKYSDASNNEHHYFRRATDEEVEGDADAEVEEAPVPKAQPKAQAKVTRTRNKASAE